MPSKSISQAVKRQSLILRVIMGGALLLTGLVAVVLLVAKSQDLRQQAMGFNYYPCVDGNFQCSGDERQRCEGGQWKFYESCDRGCNPIEKRCGKLVACTSDADCSLAKHPEFGQDPDPKNRHSWYCWGANTKDGTCSPNKPIPIPTPTNPPTPIKLSGCLQTCPNNPANSCACPTGCLDINTSPGQTCKGPEPKELPNCTTTCNVTEGAFCLCPTSCGNNRLIGKNRRCDEPFSFPTPIPTKPVLKR